jgi:hypothetical protein
MKKTSFYALAASSLIATAVLTACGGGGDDGPLPDKAVSISFAALNGSTPVKCGTPTDRHGHHRCLAADVKDLRFYITNVSLVNDKGVAVPVKLDANKPGS